MTDYRDDPDREKGWYEKYYVARLNDETGKHERCEFFVLDLVHDRHARMAMLAYAASCGDEYPSLAVDIIDRCGFGNGDTADTSGN
jgi:hypothetical protein